MLGRNVGRASAAPAKKRRWQLELAGELDGGGSEGSGEDKKRASKAPTPHRSRSRSPVGSSNQPGKPVEEGAGDDKGSRRAEKAYAWMDSDDEGAGSGSEGGLDTRSHPGSPEAAAETSLEPRDVHTLSQMLRLAETFGKRSVQVLSQQPSELLEVCSAAARVKFYDPGLFDETLAPALRRCFQSGLITPSMEAAAGATQFNLLESLEVLRALAQLNAAKALSAVFTAAIKAIEAHLKKVGGTGGLDAAQLKSLRETYKDAGREEDVAFLTSVKAAAVQGPQGSMCEGLNSSGLPMRPGARVCDMYMKSGLCRLAAGCRFDHPEGLKVTFNSEGFPMRPWTSACPYYMQMGTCDFKRNCKWHHPERREREGR